MRTLCHCHIMVVEAHENNVEDRNKSLLNLNTQKNTKIATGTKSTLYINENRQTQLKTEGYIYTHRQPRN